MSISEKMMLIKSISKLKTEIKELEIEQQSKIKDFNNEFKELEVVKQSKIDKLNKEILELDVQKANKFNNLAAEDQRLLNEVEKAKASISTLLVEIEELETKKSILNEDYIELDEEVLYQSYGIFIPEYRYELSEEYKRKLDEIGETEKLLIKNGESFKITSSIMVDGSSSKGLKKQNNNGKIAVRAFKSETDDTIKTISAINFQSKAKKIDQVFKQINILNATNGIVITNELREIAHEKLELMFEYKNKIVAEKEEVKAQKEQLREEAKAKKELELAFKKLEAEKQKFITEHSVLAKKLENTDDAIQVEKIRAELSNIEKHLDKIADEEVTVNDRLANTRAGHVYIISNIGSFGEQIYKIGMTRRMDPLDRVKELGDASVPFVFDVHALIFTEDAYQLENELHKVFAGKRVNKVNHRKEFFNVTLEEIKEVVHNHYNKPVSFIDTPEAIEYNETMVLERQ